MTLTQALALSLRMLRRDWRAGELQMFALALVIAVGAVTAVGFFTDRVTRGMVAQSADLLGADLVLVSPRPVDAAWLDEARGRGLRHTAMLDFSSVVLKGDNLQLAGVRAVHTGFPLRGTLRTAPTLYAADSATDEIPARGTAWVEARILHALQARIGDRIQLGASEFTLTRVLTYEPGSGGNFFALAPRVLIHHDDVAATGIIQPGSRVSHAHAFAGDERAVRALQAALTPRLISSQKLLDAESGNASVSRATGRMERFLGLTGLLAVLLAGVAIAMAARRYSARHYDMSALLRCLGATQRDITRLYLPALALLGLLASLAGVVVGWLAQWVIDLLVGDLLPRHLPPPGPMPALIGLLTGLITLAGFAAVPVLRLRRVPPLRVLRHELVPLPPSAWLVYGAAATALISLMWYHTADLRLTLTVFGGALAAGLLLAPIAVLLLQAGGRLVGRMPLVAGASWRLGIANLRRRGRASVGQIMAFGLTLMAMTLIALVRTDLMASWQNQLPPETPNHFAFNILPADVDAVRAYFTDNAIAAQALYPMVRGRLTAINGEPVTQRVSKEEDEGDTEALQRELNLSWSDTVPPDNAVLSGDWWQAGQTTGVSVESRLAEKLRIGLGDQLEFTIGSATLVAHVASLRSVQWDSFHPNFYMIFPPGALDAFPATYLTSFYLAPAQKPLLTGLVRGFPAVTVLETDQILAKMRAVLRQVALTVEFILVFVLAAGFAVLFAALTSSLDERYTEGALLRALGARRAQLRGAHLAEFAALGALAGLLAALGSELIAWQLYTRVFDLVYAFNWAVWLITPVVGALLIGSAGYLGTRRVLTRSPLTVLREG